MANLHKTEFFLDDVIRQSEADDIDHHRQCMTAGRNAIQQYLEVQGAYIPSLDRREDLGERYRVWNKYLLADTLVVVHYELPSEGDVVLAGSVALYSATTPVEDLAKELQEIAKVANRFR